MEDIINTIINLALGGGIGVISFFLKRSFDRLDSCASKSELKEYQTEFRNLTDKYAEREDLKECQNDVKQLSAKFATKEEVKEIKERMDKLDNGIDFLKENSVRKDDFVRTNAEISSKIDDLTTYLRGKL